MKKIIKRILNKLGWELQRARATMPFGLRWLRDQNFSIKTVLDVGASNGSWTRECQAFFPQADYVLFEPQPVHSFALDSFAKSCNQRVVLIKKAVGDSEGTTFFDASDPFGGALANRQSSNTIEVEITTIDSVVSREKLESPCLLKLDTHGFEKKY